MEALALGAGEAAGASLLRLGLGPTPPPSLGTVRAVLTTLDEVSVETPLAAALGPLMPASAVSVARVTAPGLASL
ncbi:MAG TPA: hypothetical protein VJS38_20755 [Phenylobacterium sp.]|uniref:hypothetical protein n=1 Tax=Phenylobacterium sp. TaxID=1871053 RepID=UPI002B469D4B|nr:hypothetical protein [Phenylobacterium sp.]HKR90608.1 hypothetical protein [Phenylobacterium sp.]